VKSGSVPPDVLEYLRRQYEGIFEEAQLERHVRDYLGYEVADAQVEQVLAVTLPGSPDSPMVLDVGCGFGSFVIAARKAGLAAVGVDVAPFEIAYARGCLAETEPQTDAASVFIEGTGLRLPFEDGAFRVVTLWNVLEHVPDLNGLLAEVSRVLKPGGALHLVCPNYAAWREEAHYHVFLPGRLPKPLILAILRLRGKDPSFFAESVFCRTNLEVLRALRRHGFRAMHPTAGKLNQPDSITSARGRKIVQTLSRARLLWPLRLGLSAVTHNPLRGSVSLVALKEGA